MIDYFYISFQIKALFISRSDGGEHVEEEEKNSADFVKPIIFGGLDGLLVSFAIVSAGAGGGLPWQTVLILGFSIVAANALAIGAGEFLSSKAHKEFVQAEKRRELYEFKRDKVGEIEEMVNTFQNRGMSRPDAEIVVKKVAQYENFFINLKITEELGVQPPEDDDFVLFIDALVMFISFGLFGFIPLVPYCFTTSQALSAHSLYVLSAAIAGITLFLLGSIKSTFR